MPIFPAPCDLCGASAVIRIKAGFLCADCHDAKKPEWDDVMKIKIPDDKILWWDNDGVKLIDANRGDE